MHVFARALPQQNWTTDQPANQEKERGISHARPHRMIRQVTTKKMLGTRFLRIVESSLIRVFPTQGRGALCLIFKGCHCKVLRVIEFVLTSHERAPVTLKTPETTLTHYNPSIPQSYHHTNAHLEQATTLYIAQHQLTRALFDWGRRIR